MNMRVQNPIERRRVADSECRQIDRTDPHFGSWLKQYTKDNPSSWLGSGKKHKYWLVPVGLAEDAIDVLAKGEDHRFLASCYRLDGSEEYLSVLVIAPPPTEWQLMWRAVWGAVALRLFWLVFKMSDFWFKWGVKRCPNCFSKDLYPFTYESPDEAPSHYCNGCNTIWPPRA